MDTGVFLRCWHRLGTEVSVLVTSLHSGGKMVASHGDMERVGAATCLSQLLAQAEVHQTEQQRKRWRNVVIDIFRFPLTLVKT